MNNKMNKLSKWLVSLLMLVLMIPIISYAGSITIPTYQLKTIHFQIISTEIPFGIDMHYNKINPNNLNIVYQKSSGTATMTVINQTQEYGVNILFRLQDASNGGCYVSINGNRKNTTITVDSSQHSKCSLSQIDYSTTTQTLNIKMKMD